jgi:hypothetical protein
MSCYYTCMTKLTLSVRSEVVRAAKRFARARRTSVSRLVEQFLRGLTEPARPSEVPPVLRRIRGLLRKGGLADYRRHLVRKYR